MRLRLKDWRLYEMEPREESCPRETEAEPIFMDSVTAAEALMAAGKLSDRILEDGEAAYCAWVAERDWLFTTRFPRPVGERVYLVFEGLDTDCDLWLNGEKIASHHSMYLPLRLDVTERRLPFPAAKLTVSAEGDTLVITTDAYARCVELSGETEEGDAFGWFFEDNYFDLLPFETRRVRVGGRHTAGTLTARAHYSPYSAHLRWEKGEK